VFRFAASPRCSRARLGRIGPEGAPPWAAVPSASIESGEGDACLFHLENTRGSLLDAIRRGIIRP
jgi:hypothetical protein